MAERVLSFDMGTRNLAFALVGRRQEPTGGQEHGIHLLRLGMIDLQKHAAREATESLVLSITGDGENSWMSRETCPVVIELQPRGGICKTLSHVLQAVFLTANPARVVRFLHAKSKFQFRPDMLHAAPPQDYAERKALAVQMAKTVLEPGSKFAVFFDSRPYKQQTDLADAILQAAAWLVAC